MCSLNCIPLLHMHLLYFLENSYTFLIPWLYLLNVVKKSLLILIPHAEVVLTCQSLVLIYQCTLVMASKYKFSPEGNQGTSLVSTSWK